DVGDHVAAALPRRRLGECIFGAVERTNSGGPVNLVPREHVEVRAEFGDVGGYVLDRLRAVDQHAGAVAVTQFDDLVDRDYGAESIRNVAGGNQFGARTQQLFELAQQQVARVIDRSHLEDRSGLLRNQLPRNDIRVMLQVRDDKLVTRLQVLAPPRVRHQVDRLGGAADEHDVLRAGRPDEVGDGVPRLLVGVGGSGRQFVCGPVNVGVLVRVELHQPVDHHLRLLRGGGVVEPDQRLSVDDLFEDREVRPHRVDVEDLVLVGQLRNRV